MDYLWFDLLAVALPTALLLSSAPDRGRLRWPVTILALLALLWTAPWDDHLVRSGVWSYTPSAVLARIGAVPIEEYAFVILEVLLTGAWALRSRTLAPQVLPDLGEPSARRRGLTGWLVVAAAGAALVTVGGHARYFGLLLVWGAPPLALQCAVAGDALVVRRRARLRTAVPVALWLCVADRLALAHGIWSIGPASSTGLDVLGLPLEEALFFGLTCLLVTDGLMLACDIRVLSRAADLGRSLVAPVAALDLRGAVWMMTHLPSPVPHRPVAPDPAHRVRLARPGGERPQRP